MVAVLYPFLGFPQPHSQNKDKMNTRKIIAGTLLAIGILSMAYAGFDYAQAPQKVYIGALQLMTDKPKHVAVSLCVAASALLIGVLLLIAVPRRS